MKRLAVLLGLATCLGVSSALAAPDASPDRAGAATLVGDYHRYQDPSWQRPQLAQGHGRSTIELFENEGFRGHGREFDRPIRDLRRAGFNDATSSIVVRGGQWEICQDVDFHGRCVVLGPGQYNMNQFGLRNDSLSSLRPVEGHRQNRW